MKKNKDTTFEGLRNIVPPKTLRSRILCRIEQTEDIPSMPTLQFATAFSVIVCVLAAFNYASQQQTWSELQQKTTLSSTDLIEQTFNTQEDLYTVLIENIPEQ